MNQQKEFYAFVSYKREDEEWARWLQNKLEHYKFPTNLNGRTDLPKSIRPIFRDVTDMKPGLLAEEIYNALHDSEWLIVVCSPRSAKSPWVCKEAQAFIDLGRADHIIPFIIEGTPFSTDFTTECYPEALRNLIGSKELLAANVNEMGRDAAAIKVVARMFNLRFDTLWQRFDREQRRKRWMYVGGSVLFALLSLGIGLYFVKQNGIIVSQNIKLEDAASRLREDSVTLANHIERILRDSVTLSVQNDSIVFQNARIISQHDSIRRSAEQIVLSNLLLEKERDNVLHSNVSLNLSLLNTYLSQGRPEMSVVVINDLEQDLSLMDSLQLSDYCIMKESLCDSILADPAFLVDYSNLKKSTQTNIKAFLRGGGNSHITLDDLDGDEVLSVSNEEQHTSETITGQPKVNIVANDRLTHLAVYKEGRDDYDGMDLQPSPGKAGIGVYSLETGNLEHFIGCGGWFYWMTFPMALSGRGKHLIYHEGWRASEKTWYMDFEKKRRVLLQSSNTNNTLKVSSSFSPDDRWFYLHHEDNNEIDVYSTRSLAVIRTFRYDDCNSVYWDDSSNICISSRGKTYSWKISEGVKNHVYRIGSFAEGVSISRSNRYAAAACDDGLTYVWDNVTGRTVLAQEVIDSPMDVAFTEDEKCLWVISGYNSVNTINLESRTVESVYDEDESYPPHPWRSFLQMTGDGKHCIARCYYGDMFALFNVKGGFMSKGSGFDDYVKEHPEDILSQFSLPEVFNYDPNHTDPSKPELTARRVSSDGDLCIEGYSNGMVKIYSMKQKERIVSLIARMGSGDDQ